MLLCRPLVDLIVAGVGDPKASSSCTAGLIAAFAPILISTAALLSLTNRGVWQCKSVRIEVTVSPHDLLGFEICGFRTGRHLLQIFPAKRCRPRAAALLCGPVDA
eukprot:Skav214646  [mRNA]  locus=scaffold1660:17087:19614:+ [translate_table: standard]